MLLMWINPELIANEKKLGIQIGTNYFIKTQKIEYTAVDKSNRDRGGKLLYDNNGHSFQIGITYSITNHFSLVSEYRFPRTCSYSYPSTWTPWVWGPNTYWVKTESSSLRLGGCFRFNKSHFIQPYLGTGYELFRLKAWSRSGHIRGDSGELLYIDDDYYYRGLKFLNGLFLSAGIMNRIKNNLFISLSISYTFIKLEEWKSYRDADQNLSGFYFHMSLIAFVF